MGVGVPERRPGLSIRAADPRKLEAPMMKDRPSQMQEIFAPAGLPPGRGARIFFSAAPRRVHESRT